MNISILTPEKSIYEGEASSVKVPGITGAFEVLDNHAPIVSALGTGKVRIIKSGENLSFDIEKGFIEVLNNEVNLLVDVNPEK